MILLDSLRAQFNDRVEFREKRPGIEQLIAPLYYEDGDMVDIFIELPRHGSQRVRICDFGMTMMRLFKREVVASLFYETLQEFVEEHLGEYHPQPGKLHESSAEPAPLDGEENVA